MNTLIKESLQSVVFVIFMLITAAWFSAQVIDYIYIRYSYAEIGHDSTVPWMAGRQEWNFTYGEERSKPAAK